MRTCLKYQLFPDVRFLGCSEAKYKHDYGCDKELQNVDIRDKANRKTQVSFSKDNRTENQNQQY